MKSDATGPIRDEPRSKRQSGSLPCPPRLIDDLCESLSYEGEDREYVRNLFKRHELGAATKPERLLPPLLVALASQVPVRVTVNNGAEMSMDVEMFWSESNGPLPIFEIVREKVRAEPKHPWNLDFRLFIRAGLAPDPALLQRAAALVRAIESGSPLDRCETLLVAASSLYDEISQTWAVWSDVAGLAERRPPDELKTFAAHAWDEISDWISAGIESNRQIVFLVPLVSASEPPDLPGPNDATLDPLVLVEMADAAAESGN